MGGGTTDGDAMSPDRRDLSYADIEVGDPVGSGGTATVHRATLPDGTPVAVKQPQVEGTVTRDAAEAFVHEAETWADIDDHPHVVGLVDWDATPVPWIAMEYMDGGSLATRSADGPLDLTTAREVGRQVCEAVRHAHRHGIVHLDLKPANVLFRTAGADPVAKVADWGLARSLRESSGTVEGLSPAYAAPEQFDPEAFGEPDDFTDIYQVGAVLYEALTGRPPFEGSGVAVMRAVVDDEPDPPSAVVPSLPEAVDEVVLRALATEKDDRYETVVDLRRALSEWVIERDPPIDEAVTAAERVEAALERAGAVSGDATESTDTSRGESATGGGDETGDSSRNGVVTYYSDSIDEYRIELEDGSAVDFTPAQVDGDVVTGDPVEVETMEIDGETRATGIRPVDGFGRRMRGVVTYYSDSINEYTIRLEEGSRVEFRPAQVDGDVVRGDPVGVKIAEIDDRLYATSIEPLPNGFGESRSGVVSYYSDSINEYQIKLEDGSAVDFTPAQVDGEVAKGDPVEVMVGNLGDELYATHVRPL